MTIDQQLVYLDPDRKTIGGREVRTYSTVEAWQAAQRK